MMKQTKEQTMDETLEKIWAEIKEEKSIEDILEDSFQRVEMDPLEDDFFKMSLEERLDLLPF